MTGALFYGRSKDTLIGDISLACFEAFFGCCPMFWMKGCIKEYRPKVDKLDIEIVTAGSKTVVQSTSVTPRSVGSDQQFEFVDIQVEDGIGSDVNIIANKSDRSDRRISTVKTIEKLLETTPKGTSNSGEEKNDDTGNISIDTASKENLYDVLKLQNHEIASHIDVLKF